MLFGKDNDKGLVMDGMKLKVVKIGENGITPDDILVHDPTEDNLGLQTMLADMKGPDFPVALGVIRDVKDITYDDEVQKQVDSVKANARVHSVDELLHSGSTWSI